jgi:hypothetical protein
MSSSPVLPPEVQLFQFATGFVLSQSIYAAAKLNLADHIAATPTGERATADLAKISSASEDALYRLLRALATIGIFRETQPRTFALTPMAELLKADHPAKLRAAVIMFGETQYGPWGDIMHSMTTGRPAFDHIFGKPIFEYLSANPHLGQIFDDAMTGIHGGETRPMIAAANFSAFDTIIDIGGGNASVLIEILRAAPSTRGIVFDLPAVADRTRQILREARLDDRCTAAPGSFFQPADIPRAGPQSAYLLRHIIHDWDDDRSIQILENCRRAAAPGAKILVVESVIPEGNEPHPGKWLDMIMLVGPAGRERTAAEYSHLFTRAGLGVPRITPTQSPVSIIESTVSAP